MGGLFGYEGGFEVCEVTISGVGAAVSVKSYACVLYCA